MAVVLFDLDNTLLAGDSDYLWNVFLVDQGLVNEGSYREENERFYADYERGELDITAYQEFQLAAMAKMPLSDLERHRHRFVDQCIMPIVLPKARTLVDHHREQGDTLLIITATNRFVTEPIASLFAVDCLIATEPQWLNGGLTGKITGIPCYQGGKVERMQVWMHEHGLGWEDSWCYSDSHNDIPLLEQVSHPVAVNPDPSLANIAGERHWTVLNLRE